MKYLTLSLLVLLCQINFENLPWFFDNRFIFISIRIESDIFRRYLVPVSPCRRRWSPLSLKKKKKCTGSFASGISNMQGVSRRIFYWRKFSISSTRIWYRIRTPWCIFAANIFKNKLIKQSTKTRPSQDFRDLKNREKHEIHKETVNTR